MTKKATNKVSADKVISKTCSTQIRESYNSNLVKVQEITKKLEELRTIDPDTLHQHFNL